jgi:hypothetical protein
MIKYKNQYTQKAYDIIMPLIGDLMARNVLKIQSQNIGKTEESLAFGDIPKLAQSIKGGLGIFIGSEAANNIAMKIASIR